MTERTFQAIQKVAAGLADFATRAPALRRGSTSAPMGVGDLAAFTPQPRRGFMARVGNFYNALGQRGLNNLKAFAADPEKKIVYDTQQIINVGRRGAAGAKGFFGSLAQTGRDVYNAANGPGDFLDRAAGVYSAFNPNLANALPHTQRAITNSMVQSDIARRQSR